MMKKKNYRHLHFSADTIKLAQVKFAEISGKSKVRWDYEVSRGDESWTFDSFESFLADYRKTRYEDHTTCVGYSDEGRFSVIHFSSSTTEVKVTLPDRQRIDQIFEVFEAAAPSAAIQLPEETLAEQRPTIFIGHGRSHQWRDLKDHLVDKHGFKVEAYETGARAGHTVRDILESMLRKSSFALLVLTAEDEMEDGTKRARQNVVHETGLFQGKLGFGRAIVLLEKGAEEFSNIAGIEQIRYSAGNIKETFGDVLATIRREFDEPA